MSISLFTGASLGNDGTCENNPNTLPPPQKNWPACCVYFQYPLSCSSRRKRLTNMAKKPSTDFLHKHREKSPYQPDSRARDPSLYFFNGMCVFHKYLICEIAADICLQARGWKHANQLWNINKPSDKHVRTGRRLMQKIGSVFILMAGKIKHKRQLFCE